MLRGMAEELIGVLNEESAIYSDLLEIARKKAKIIAENEVKELDEITNLEQSLVLRIGKLENLRERIIRQIGTLLSLPPQEITVSKLSGKLDKDLNLKLQDVQGKLLKQINELKELNERNGKLIRNILDYINFSLNLITTAGNAGDNSYEKSGTAGDLKSSKVRNLFDSKA